MRSKAHAAPAGLQAAALWHIRAGPAWPSDSHCVVAMVYKSGCDNISNGDMALNNNVLGWWLVAVALGGCGKPDARAGDKQAGDNQAANTMSCTVDGAMGFSASGAQVSLASLGGNAASASLGLGMHADSIGRRHEMSTGLVVLPMAPGSYQFPEPGTPGLSPAYYRIKNEANETLEDYTGSGYAQFYALADQDPQARLVLAITRFEQLPASVAHTRRVSLAGSFRFNAAYAPYANGKLPDACTMEAITRSMNNIGKPVSYPRFDPGLCGARQHRIECTFDVTGNLIVP
jgi:hypothetical protein